MTRKGLLSAACVLGSALFSAAPVQAHSGHLDWGNWRFDWEVKDDAGLGIRNVFYKNKQILYKGSMPVVRVQYAGNGCGPYADRIDWDSLLKISNCGDNKFCVRQMNIDGREWLQIGILAKIGAYRLNQRWWFSDDGYLTARLSSKGLQCNIDHDHHPYWRMDFDLNGASSDQIFVFDNNRPNEGWGPGWRKRTAEFNQVKNPPTDRKWFVRDNPTALGMWVWPSGDDGTSNSFSSKDVGGRRYHSNEDVPWAFGAWGHLGYDNAESIAEQDDILWYVAHMHHHASEGSDQWHSAGPWMKVN